MIRQNVDQCGDRHEDRVTMTAGRPDSGVDLNQTKLKSSDRLRLRPSPAQAIAETCVPTPTTTAAISRSLADPGKGVQFVAVNQPERLWPGTRHRRTGVLGLHWTSTFHMVSSPLPASSPRKYLANAAPWPARQSPIDRLPEM